MEAGRHGWHTGAMDLYGEAHGWPFHDSPDLAVFVTAKVHDEGLPVLWVVHDADGDWLFANGDDFDPKTASVIHLSHVVEGHPDVAEVADLPLGWHAQRDAVGAPWHRKEYVVGAEGELGVTVT